MVHMPGAGEGSHECARAGPGAWPADNRAMFKSWIFALLGVALAGCSPSLNWRSVPLEPLGLSASLPCKPDRIERSIELAGAPVQVHMAGCAADGATVAVACAALPPPALAGAALAHWRSAVLAALRAPPAGQAGAAQDQPFVPTGALALPQSVRTRAQGQQPDGSGAAFMDAVWFARLQGTQLQACHAVVYSAQPRPDVADVLLTGLVLQ